MIYCTHVPNPAEKKIESYRHIFFKLIEKIMNLYNNYLPIKIYYFDLKVGLTGVSDTWDNPDLSDMMIVKKGGRVHQNALYLNPPARRQNSNGHLNFYDFPLLHLYNQKGEKNGNCKWKF